MKTALFTICFSLALVAPNPTLSYSYNRHPITTSDDNTTGIQQQQQQQQQQHVLTFPSLPITISDDTTTGIQQQQQQQHVPTLPSLPITTKAPSSMTFGGQVVEYVPEQQKQTVHTYLNDLMQTLKTYGAPEVVQEAAEETVEHIQENLEDVQETAEEIAEEVQETAEETLEHIQETLENVNKTGKEIAEEVHDHIQEIGSERAEYIEETVENVREAAEEQVERVQEALENIQETVEERVEEIQESMANATEATEEQAEEAQEAIEDVREYAQETVEEHVEQVQEILESVQDTAEEQHEQAVEALGEVGEYIQEASEQQMEQAQETLQQVKEYAQEAYEQLLEAIKDNDGGIAYTYAPVAITTTDFSDEVDDNDGYAVSTFAPYATNSDNGNGSNEVTTVVVTTTDDDVSQEVNDNADSDEVTTDADNSDDNDVTTTTASYNRTLIPEDSSEEADSADSDATSDDSDDVDSDEVTITTPAPAVHTTVLSVEDSAEDDDDDDVFTTTTAAPVSTTVVPNLCDGCDFKHGVGYNPHPSDCTLFVQCRLSQKGYPVVAGVKSCAHGLYWNQQKLTCDYRRNVKCVDDVCMGQKKTKRSGASCRGYWDCRSGTVTAKCCARGFAYNPVTARCHYQPDCQDDCLATSTQVSLECGQGMRGVQGDSTVYEVKTGPSTWTRMPCPATLAFSTNPCGCNVPRTQQQLNREPVCTPELYLPFHSDAKDFSGRNVYVKNDGVLVKGGKAFFDGHSRLTVNRFSNAWWGATVYVHLRFKSLSSSRQALVSNGDCQVRPSLAVCAGPGGVDFYAETQNRPVPANFTVPYGYTQGSGWQDVLYKLDGNQLSGFVNTHSSQASTKGNLESRQRGLVIGSGGGCEDFEGFMDEVTVYLCKPDYK